MADVDHKCERVSPAAATTVADKVDGGAMGDSQGVVPKPSASKKKAAATKAKRSTVSGEHPKYSVMIADAISQLKERKGSSRQAIIKYITSHYQVGTEVNKINARIKMALNAGVKSGLLKQCKGTGASGSFRLGQRQKSSQKTARPRSTMAKNLTESRKKIATKKSKMAVNKTKSPAKKSKTAVTKTKSPAKKTKSPAKTKATPKKMKTAASKGKPKSAAGKMSVKQKKLVKKTAGKK